MGKSTERVKPIKPPIKPMEKRVKPVKPNQKIKIKHNKFFFF